MTLAGELPGSGLAIGVRVGFGGVPGTPRAPDTARFVDYFKRFAPTQGVLNTSPAPVIYAETRAALAEPPPAVTQAEGEREAAGSATAPDGRASDGAFVPVPAERVLQVHKSFLVTQDEQGVVIIDQHALHERVMFEYLPHRVLAGGAGGLERQRLLAPVVIHASAHGVERLPDLAVLLGRIGVEAEAMGPTAIGVHAFPSFLFERGVDPGEFIAELFERADAEGFAPASEQALAEVLDMMACKAAVRAGDRMSDMELGDLLKLRDLVERSASCPHGRPTSIRLTIRELEKRFGRA
jgi:DNA mismatch repair protein MutL